MATLFNNAGLKSQCLQIFNVGPVDKIIRNTCVRKEGAHFHPLVDNTGLVIHQGSS